MSSSALKREQLLELYKQYEKESPWPEWAEDYLATVNKFTKLSAKELGKRTIRRHFGRQRE